MKYAATLTGEVEVEFLEPEKAKACFLEDGSWRDSFFRFESFDQLVTDIVNSFHHEPTRICKEFGGSLHRKDMEGYGPFFKVDGKWILKHDCWIEECGQIFIKESEEVQVEDVASA